MSHQFLHGANVHSITDEVGGEGVAEFAATNAPARAGLPGIVLPALSRNATIRRDWQYTQ
jgi:hypothetical protein